MYPDFSIGPLTIHTFGLMMALGFVAAGTVAYFEFKRKGLNPEHVYWLTIAAAVGGLIGSKVHYLLLHMDELRNDPLASAFSGAGLVWYGGLIGGAIAAVIVIFLYHLPLGKALDACAPALAIGYAFGRMGCFLNGDDYGRPSTLPWSMQFPKGSPPTTIQFGQGVSVQPTQLYESFSSLAIFAIIMYLRPRLKRDWSMACLYLAIAGTERFLVEFVRMQREGQLQQQLLALGTAIIALAAFVWIQTRPEGKPKVR
ncbi:MAG: prolipoprotein diacylglyceryl transferase [Actinobacteria bacterium]|nr:prolipoprotein diacylglyceryl transferase [Actinomycetota bacterium]MCL5882667.1 prolipoprotein diacylglyceryl transferase [Actinomycetota bacterium]